MISSPYWVKNKKIAHKQLNAEGLVSSGAQKAIKEIGKRSQGGEGKHLPPPSPFEWRKGEQKEKYFIPGSTGTISTLFNTMMVPLGWGLLSESLVWNRVWKAESFGDNEAPRIWKKKQNKIQVQKSNYK